MRTPILAASGPTPALASALAFALVLQVGAPIPLAGQDLARIEVLGMDGRAADARDSLLAWWDAEWDDASRSEREHALWLRGLLTLDPTEASATYRRMVTEYPVGARTGQALYRLGSLAAAVGDSVAAARWFGILERDFPGSGRGEGPGVLRGAARPSDGMRPEAGVGAGAVAARPTPARAGAGADTGGAPAPDDPPPAVGDWTVQLGAFASESTAREIAQQARGAGFEIRVVLVEGSDLWRVRSGRFTEADGARPLLDRMLAAGLEAAIVPGADRERAGG